MLDSVAEEKRILEERLRDVLAQLEQCQGWQSELTDSRQKLSEALEEKNGLEERLQQVSAQLERSQEWKSEVTESQEKLSEALKEKNGLEERLQQVSVQLEQSQERRREVAESQEKLHEALEEKSKLEEQLQQVSAQLEQDTRDMAENQRIADHHHHNALEEVVARTKKDADTQLQGLRVELSQAVRERTETQQHLRVVESCVDGWKNRATETRSQLERVTTDYQALVQADMDRSKLIEEQKDQLDKLDKDLGDSVAAMEELRKRTEAIELERNQANQALKIRDQDHQRSSLDTAAKAEAQMATQQESHEKEKSNMEALHASELQEAVLRAVTEANALRDDAFDEAVKKHVEVIQFECDQANQALKIRDQAHQKTLLDTAAKAEAQLASQQESHEKEKSDMEATHASELREAVLRAVTEANALRDNAFDETEAVKKHVEAIQLERDQANQTLKIQDQDHQKALLDIAAKAEAQMATQQESHEKEKSDMEALHASELQEAVLRAVTEANTLQDETFDEAVKKRVEAIQLECDQANQALKTRDQDHQQSLLDTTAKNEAQMATQQESHEKEKRDMEAMHANELHEAILRAAAEAKKLRDKALNEMEGIKKHLEASQLVHTQALKKQDDDHQRSLLEMSEKNAAEVAALQLAHEGDRAETGGLRDRAFQEAVQEHRTKISQEEQAKAKVLLDKFVAEYPTKMDRWVAQKLDETEKLLQLEVQKTKRLEEELSELRLFRDRPQNSGHEETRARPGQSQSMAVDIDMEPPLSERARGKQPESLNLPRAKTSKPSTKRKLRFPTASTQQNNHTTEPIAPPMRFPMPRGADTPLADRLRMPTQPTPSRSRSQTLLNPIPRRPSLSASFGRAGSPSTAGSASTPARDAPPAPPNSNPAPQSVPPRADTPIELPHANFAFSSGTGPELSTPGPSNSNRFTGGQPGSFNTPPILEESEFVLPSASTFFPDPPTSSAQPMPDPSQETGSSTHTADTDTIGSVLRGFAEMASEFKSIRGELLETRKLFSTRPKKPVPCHGDFKTKTPPRPRTSTRTEMMAAARLEMNTLLEINRDPEIQKITSVTMIGPVDVTAFLDGATAPPPLQPLRPYWDMIQSPWNQHLANEFATVFMNSYSQDIVTTHDEVAEYFIQHLDTLRKHISKRVPRWEGETAAEIEERVMAEGKATRENTHRRGRLERRYDACLKICLDGTDNNTNLAWQILYAMVDALGKDGQSSDGTDGEHHAVRIREWRSASVKDLLLFVDENRKTTTASGTLIAGARPVVRVRKGYGPLSTRQAVAGLPRNFYANAWYDSLSHIEQIQLAALDPMALPDISQST